MFLVALHIGALWEVFVCKKFSTVHTHRRACKTLAWQVNLLPTKVSGFTGLDTNSQMLNTEAVDA